jgi:hypothetical protein
MIKFSEFIKDIVKNPVPRAQGVLAYLLKGGKRN